MKFLSEKKQLSCSPRQVRSKPFQALCLTALGLLVLVALWDFPNAQSTDAATQLVGRFGAYVAVWAYSLLGRAAWLIPVSCFWLAYAYLFRRLHLLGWRKLIALGLVIVSSVAWLSWFEAIFMMTPAALPKGLGGYFGKSLYEQLLLPFLGPFGSGLLLTLLLGVNISIVLLRNVNATVDRWLEKLSQWRQKCKKKRTAERSAFKKEPPIGPSLAITSVESKDEAPESLGELLQAQRDADTLDPLATLPAHATNAGATPLKIIEETPVEKAAFPVPEIKGDYQFPSLGLLRAPSKIAQADADDHAQRAEMLQRILGDFGIKVKLGEVHTGPVITRYDVLPAPGIRVEKILNLDRNIAMGLKAKAVRILAPVPGKGCVGIEVPNSHPMPVCIREILESTAWVNANAKIPLTLGKEVSGRPLVADLTRMPHLLIAGATGSGKTVCINAMITSLLYHASTEELRFVMVDPKIVEMQVYNDLPHMLIPVVTDPKKVPGALKWLINEMERRYQIFAKLGVRNISGFYERQQGKGDTASSLEERAAAAMVSVPRNDSIEIPKKLPYIVCIIDELADLMMVAPADIEACIARLAQLARAAGIHLIVATQRPSVNIITGVIKANLTSRIAFKVASKVDSRTILDGGGADHLIGRGDMLFIPPGMTQVIRIQGAFVSDDEINRIVEFLKRNGPPQYAEEMQRQIDASETGTVDEEADEWEDALIPQAIEVLRASKRASTSLLQRRLKIGYNRAARIMEILEQEQIVGPDNGQQPREILKDINTL